MAVLFCLISNFQFPISAPAQQEAYYRQTVKVRENTMALENACYRLLQSVEAKEKPGQLVLTLKGAVINNDLQVEILRSPVIGSWAEAWAPKVNRNVHQVSVRKLDKGSEFSGVFHVRLNFEGDELGQELTEGLLEIPVTVTLKGTIAGGQVKGTYQWKPDPLPIPGDEDQYRQSPMASSKGAFSGTATRLDQPAKANAEHWGFNNQTSMGQLHIMACHLENEADEWYRRVRALDMAGRCNLTYPPSLKEVLQPLIRRERLKLKAKQKAAAKKTISLDDLDLGGGDGLDDMETVVVKKKPKKGGKKKGDKPAPAKEPAGKPDNEQVRGQRELEQIVARTARMVMLVDRYVQAPPVSPHIVGTLTVEDPEFGPWYDEAALEIGKDGVNELPAEIGGEGPQEWRSVNAWTAMGPFPSTDIEAITPLLPDMVWAGGEACTARKGEMKDYSGKSVFGWQDCPRPGRWDFGYIVPPKWFSFNPYYRGLPPVLGYREYANKGHYGCPNTTAYMACRIKSPADATLWAGVGVNQRGQLWVNDQLVWMGPAEVNPIRHESTALIKLPLKQGLNQVLLRLDVDFSSPYCWLRVCLKGGPRSPEEVKAKAERVAAARRTMKPEPAVGWRGDGTGMYPGCNPPVAWNRKQKQNVLWHVPTKYFGNATPVPVPGSHKVFITEDPCWLVCLDKESGKELWRKAVTLLDLLPEAERKKGWALHEAWWKARQERDAIPEAEVSGMKHKVPKWLKYSWYWAEGTGIWAPAKGKVKDERDGASPEMIALLDKRDELEVAPDPNVVQDDLNKVLAEIEKLQAASAGDDPDSPQAKEANLKKAEGAYVDLLRKYSHTSGMGGGYWSDYCGWMFATPVTDGKYVWLKTGTDVAACFDLDGNEMWKVQVWGSGGADHTLCSPRLVDGKFVMQLNDCDPDPKARGKRSLKLLALDAATGKEAWVARGLADNSWNDSTPGVMSLTDGQNALKVIVTTCGTLVRVDNGKVLIHNPGVQGGFASPMLRDDIVIFGQAALAPVQYVMQGPERIGFKRLWAMRGGSHGLIDSGGALIVDGNIVHTVRIGRTGVRRGENTCAVGIREEAGMHEGWRAAEAYDLVTGDYAYAIPILRKGGNQWSPACASEKHVYHIAGDDIFQGIRPKAPMDMAVTTRHKIPMRLANNAIDRTYGAGAIEGDRMYIRGYYGVTCVGYTGDEGRRYEARIVARNLLDDVFPGLPKACEAKEATMQKSSAITVYKEYQHPRNVGKTDSGCLLLSGRAPHRWWLLGPVPLEAAGEALKAIGGPAKPQTGDAKVTIAGQSLQWGPLCQPHLKVPGFKHWELEPGNFTDIHRIRRVADLGKAIRGKTGIVYVMTELGSEEEQVMRFEQTLPGVRAWIGGTEIQHGDRVKFGEGLCQLLLEITVKEIPPDGLHLSPRFWASADVKQEVTGWKQAVEKRKPYLAKAVELAADSGEAGLAKTVLGQL